jgi:hypothetical protein
VKKALRVLGFAGLAVGVLAYPAAFAVDRAAGTDALIVQAADADSVATNRGMWEINGSPKAEVPGIYGSPTKAPVRLVCAKAEALVRPPEDPSLTLYLMQAGDHPLQAQTLWYFALPATLGGLVAGALLLWLSGRKKAPAEG